MRLKHILNRFQVGERLKIVYERITLTGFTKSFILIALIHCIVQVALQSVALSFDRNANDRISQLLEVSHTPRQYAFVSNGQLFMCDQLPPDGDPFASVCWPFAGPGVAIMNTTQTGDDGDSDDNGKEDKEGSHQERRVAVQRRPPGLVSRGLSAVPTFADGELTGLNVTGLSAGQVTQVSARCLQALNWPGTILRDAVGEDISFLCFQVWLLGISLVTILNESIPHMVAALVTHGLSTAWSTFQVSRTGSYTREYQTLIVDGSCDGVDVIPHFWDIRMIYYIPILALNALALICSFGVTFKLFRMYARQTFERVGASKKLNLLYSYVLLFSVFLQLSAFFTICGSALWIDAINNGVMKGSTAYRVVFTITSVIEMPWAILGWISIRREYRIWSLVFLITGLALCAAWTSMFTNVIYKWTFQNFPFFATLTVTAYIVLIGTTVLAVICRVNFGKGLPRYLKTEETFDDSSFIPVIVLEKRQSRLASVVFPDKRTSALRKGGNVNEKPPMYKDRGGSYSSRASSDSSVIDIKAPSLHRSTTGLNIAKMPSTVADDRHGRGSWRSSLFSLARFRLSDHSSRFGMGKLSLRFSAFTSNSTTSDLEHGAGNSSSNGSGGGDVPEVPEIPVPVPNLPRAPPSSYKRHEKQSVLPAKGVDSSNRRNSPIRSGGGAGLGLPTINVIPASAPRPNVLAVQGDSSVYAASETSSSASRDSWGPMDKEIIFSRSRSEPGVIATSLSRSPSGSGSGSGLGSVHSTLGLTGGAGLRDSAPSFTGLPVNPRAHRR